MSDKNKGQEPLVFYSKVELVPAAEQGDLTAHFWPFIPASAFLPTDGCLFESTDLRSSAGTLAALWGWVILETCHGEWGTCLKAVWGKCCQFRKTNDYRKQQELRRPEKACCVHRPQGSFSSFHRNNRLGAGRKYVSKEGQNSRWCFQVYFLDALEVYLDSQTEDWQDSGHFLHFHPFRPSPCFTHMSNLPF